MSYLKSLSEERQIAVLTAIIDQRIPCLVLSRNYHPLPAMLQLCRQRRLPLLRSPHITMHLVNRATLCLEIEFAPATTEHGTFLDINGVGTLLRGTSGVGKSECALALIERGYSLVADDITHIKLINERELIGRSPELNRGYMECRGLGILNIAELFGIRSVRLEKRVDLVVTFLEHNPGAFEERTGLEQSFYKILSIQVPHLDIHVRPGRDMARLVEVAALDQALKLLGHHSAFEFNQRLIDYMANR